MIWAFNGATPSFGVPGIPDAAESDLTRRAFLRGVRRGPPWVAASNGVDFQHLRALHNLPVREPEVIEVDEFGIRYQVAAEGYLQHGWITGTNTFSQHIRTRAIDAFMLFSGGPIDEGTRRAFYVIGVHNEADIDSATIEAKLDAIGSFVEKLLDEDEPVLSTIRFRPGKLVEADRHLARYLRYVAAFPQSEPRAT